MFIERETKKITSSEITILSNKQNKDKTCVMTGEGGKLRATILHMEKVNIPV